MSDSEFEVEAILDKRTKKGVLQYRVKWLGYSNDDCTWEPASNLDCGQKIEAFEEKLLLKADSAKSPSRPRGDKAEKKMLRPLNLSPHTKLFDTGAKPETFTGIVSVDGVYYIFIRFPGDTEQEMVPLDKIRDKWPMLLIKFLEKKLVIDQKQDDEDSDSGNKAIAGHTDKQENEADDQPISSQSSAPSSISSRSSHLDPIDECD